MHDSSGQHFFDGFYCNDFVTLVTMQKMPIMHRILAFLVVAPLIIIGAEAHRAAAAIPRVERVVIYKSRQTMQLLAGNEVVRSYQVALGRNPLGHKERAGDFRTPEGAYVIDRHKGDSRFYKSLHISYPNSRDLAAAKNRGLAPGGNIMIHGLPKGFEDLADVHYRRNWTKGCIAVNNAEMDEIWQLVADGTPIVIKP
jgi:murein L,D-transpeptidase YafK